MSKLNPPKETKKLSKKKLWKVYRDQWNQNILVVSDNTHLNSLLAESYMHLDYTKKELNETKEALSRIRARV